MPSQDSDVYVNSVEERRGEREREREVEEERRKIFVMLSDIYLLFCCEQNRVLVPGVDSLCLLSPLLLCPLPSLHSLLSLSPQRAHVITSLSSWIGLSEAIGEEDLPSCR
jgi:hypothetical protein